jgi:hypothetical protein
MERLNIRQREALELLAPSGTRAAKEDMAGAMSAFPWRINGTGRAIRTETLRQLERRGLVALADGEYRITGSAQGLCNKPRYLGRSVNIVQAAFRWRTLRSGRCWPTPEAACCQR